MVKRTSAPRWGTRGISRLATPDRLDKVQNASWELSAISECLSAMGRDLEKADLGSERWPGTTGNALLWLANEIERRCTVIDEVLS